VSRMVDKVKDCNTCPFAFFSGVKWRCLHPYDGGERKLQVTSDQIEAGFIPDWCPLPDRPVLVKFVGKRPAVPAKGGGDK
jgi:hypothetical protein